MIVDTMGRCYDDAIKFLLKMASNYAKNNCQDISTVKNQLFQKISIQASNAKAIRQRTQVKSVFMDDYDSNFSSKFNPLFNAENLVNVINSSCSVSTSSSIT